MNEERFEVSIKPGEAGQRLDAFVAARLQVSRARAQKLIGTATVNGTAMKAAYALRAGDAIIVDIPPLPEPAPVVLPDTVPMPPILFEDEHLIVLDKPRGLTVHPGAGEPRSTLVDVLRASDRQLSTVGPEERHGIVHRLDKETSGVMAVCKTDAAHWKLAADFAERRVRKNYLAVVCGVPPTRGLIEAPIARHSVNRKKMTIDHSGRPSATEYSVVRHWLKFALLDINLLTGRTHQIRVHLAYLQYPVAGDAVYGGGLKRALQNAPNNEVRAAIEALSGQALHSARLSFEHPINGERLFFDVPPPPDMQRLIDALDNA